MRRSQFFYIQNKHNSCYKTKGSKLKIFKSFRHEKNLRKVTETSEFENNRTKKEENSDGHLKCDVCERTFKTKQGKGIHMTKVHKEKAASNMCSNCNKIFKLKKSLECHTEMCTENSSHIYKKTGEEYNQAECDKRFETNILLMKHIVTHQVFGGMMNKTLNAK